MFEDPKTKEVFDRLGVNEKTRGGALYKALVQNGVEFLLYTLARILYPDYHYMIVLNDNTGKFINLRELVEHNYREVESIIKNFFVEIGKVGDKIIQEALEVVDEGGGQDSKEN